MPVMGGCSQVSQTKAFQRHQFKAASQGFRGLLEKFGRGTAQEQKARGNRPPVGQDAQQGEKIGTALDFVNDDQLLQRAQRGVWLVEPGQALRIFQVEIVQRVGGDQLPGQRGFATLPGTEKDGHRTAAEGLTHRREINPALNHAIIVP
jgi:hypothetical protein